MLGSVACTLVVPAWGESIESKGGNRAGGASACSIEHVPKSDGGWRLACDYRDVNSKLVHEAYMPPPPDMFFDQLQYQTAVADCQAK